MPNSLAGILCLLCVVSTCPAGTVQPFDEADQAIAAAVAKASPSVVRLQVIGSRNSDAADIRSDVTTGVVISEDGDILTSAFALQGEPQAILVQTLSGDRLEATIVATDDVRRIVLLSTRAGTWSRPDIAPRDSVQTGQWAIALGCVLDPKVPGVSVGIISGLNRIHGLAFQTDAKISPLNYGGPLIDRQGRVLGILVPLSPGGRDDPGAGVEWYDSGIGFAIPIEDAMQSAERMRAEGDLRTGRLGLAIRTESPWEGPIVVDTVVAGGPADIAGIRVGDQLTAVNGVSLERRGVLEALLGRSYAGDRLTMDIQRAETPLSLDVELVDRLPRPDYGHVGLLPVTRIGPDGEIGPPVVLVLPDGPAAVAGVPATALCRTVGEKQSGSVSDLVEALGFLSAGARTTLSVTPRETDNAEPRSLELTTVALSGSPMLVSDEILERFQQVCLGPQADTEPKIVRKEITPGKAGRCIVLQPERVEAGHAEEHGLPGVVVLLSELASSEADVMDRWRDLIHSHHLQVMIPVNPEDAPLTAADLPLIQEGLMMLAAEAPFDRQRVVAVAEPGHVAIAGALVLSPRSPVRAAALAEGWFHPPAGIDLRPTRRALLFLSQAADQESHLLRDQAILDFRDAGVRVFQSANPDASASDRRRPERLIADWSLQITAL